MKFLPSQFRHVLRPEVKHLEEPEAKDTSKP